MAATGARASQGKAPSEVFAHRLRAARKKRGWSQQRLATRLTELGYTLQPTAITRIENAARGEGEVRSISLDDAIAIAIALDTPLPMMFLPLGAEDGVALTPSLKVHPSYAMNWIEGQEPLPGTDLAAWRLQTEVLWLYRELGEAQSEVTEAERLLIAEQYVDNPDRIQQARERYRDALSGLRDCGMKMRERDIRTPALPAKWRKDMKAMGLDVEGIR